MRASLSVGNNRASPMYSHCPFLTACEWEMNKNHWIMIITALWTSCFRRRFASDCYKRLYKSSCWIIHDDEHYVRSKIFAGPEIAGGGRTDLARERATEKVYRPGRLYPQGGRLERQKFSEMTGRGNSVLWRLLFAEVRRFVMVTFIL